MNLLSLSGLFLQAFFSQNLCHIECFMFINVVCVTITEVVIGFLKRFDKGDTNYQSLGIQQISGISKGKIVALD